MKKRRHTDVSLFHFDRPLVKDMCNDIADHAAREDTEQARDHEAVVQDIFTDMRRAGTVKVDAGEVRRIRRQEEVTVASRDKGQNDDWIYADGQSQRYDDRDGSCLRVNEFRSEEQSQCIRPRIGLNETANQRLEFRHVVREARISHPGNTINTDNRTKASMEDLALANIFRVDFAENKDSCSDDEHDHLNDRRHGNWLHYALSVRESRQNLREVAEHSDNDDAEEENVHRTIERRRQFLVLQRLRLSTVNILFMSRVLDVFLENRIVSKVLAAAITPGSSNEHTAERSRNGDRQQVDDGKRQR